MLQEGKFREDLYYRIQVFKLSLPPLRERREDIPLLAQHFVDRLNRLKGKDITGLSREALASFMHYDWPGNIRELENSIEHAFILCHGGLIGLRHLPAAIAGRWRDGGRPADRFDPRRNRSPGHQGSVGEKRGEKNGHSR